MVQLLPAGMRNNNPGNIKFIGQPGTTPSINTDQGDPQAVFASPEAGMAAMATLLSKKYLGGKTTPNMIIAGQGGWTPGNFQAAANVARSAGLGADEDILFSDPARAQRFMRALLLQEHGEASNAYTDEQIVAALNGLGGSGTIVPTSAIGGLFAREPTAATQAFRPALGDVVAPQPVETTPFGDDINTIGLGFLKRAEERQAREAESERERRRALFAQPTVAIAPAGLAGLYS